MTLHYHTMCMYFRGDYDFPKAAVTADGAPIAVFKGTKKNLFKKIKEQIYNPSGNYKKPVRIPKERMVRQNQMIR